MFSFLNLLSFPQNKTNAKHRHRLSLKISVDLQQLQSNKEQQAKATPEAWGQNVALIREQVNNNGEL